MSSLNKKRKLGHQPHAAAGEGEATDGGEAADPRFVMDLDFMDSEDELRRGHEAAGPGPGSAKRSSQRGTKRSAKAASGPGGSGSNGPQGGMPLGEAAGSAGAQDAGGVVAGEGESDGEAAGGEGRNTDGSDDGDGGDAVVGSDDGQEKQQRSQKKVLSKRKLERVKEASDRRGIVYISRIPPHMKPHKLRQLLEPFGELGRVYCAPEDPALRRMRKKKGGNSGKNFTEGWVEFEDKRRAKRAALALNGQQMGGSKRSAYHYDLWNIKYLPKFKWDTLTEEINYQRAVREQRLVAEISAAKRERDFYLSRVDKAKAIDAIKERRAKKQLAAGGEGGPSAEAGAAGGSASGARADAAGSGPAPEGARPPRLERHFGQRRAKADPVLDDSAPVLADDVLGLLGRRRQ